MDAISCPYCNSVLSHDDVRGADGKVRCPRCGEPLPVTLHEPRPSLTFGTTTSPPEKASWSNRTIGFSVLGVMVLMAIGGLTLALLTVESRRKNDYRVTKSTHPPTAIQAPGEVAGLGFLPPEVNFVAAMQVAELLKDPEGKKLLEAPRPAAINVLLDAVQKWTRLRAEDLDQIAAGTEIKDKLPQLTVVVTTRNAYDPAALAKALQPSEPTEYRRKKLFRFAAQPGECMLWCPEPRTLVLLIRLDALKLTDLESIPLMPRKGASAVPAAIKEVMERISKQSLIWVAGDFRETDALRELLPLAPLPAELARFLMKLTAIGLSVSSQDGLVLVGDFRAGADVARVLEKELKGLRVPNMQWMVAAPPPELSGTTGQWTTLQLRATPQTFREALTLWGK
jgi:predicted Zn finger-like uncharacterized protein